MKSQVLGIEFDGLTIGEAAARALALTKQPRSAYICTPNPEIVWDAQTDRALRGAIAGADMVLPDGIGIVWASRVLGCPVPERVAGIDLLMALLGRFHGRLFLLGGRPGVAEHAAETIRAQFPDLTIVGCHDGYFDDPESAYDAVCMAAPELILVCMGSPKQELFMVDFARILPAGLMIGLGGTLDVLAGDVPRAPERWRRLGLEWLYRLLREPWRIRRLGCLPRFVWAVFRERIKKRGSEEPQSRD